MPNATRETVILDSGVTVEKIDSTYVLGGDMILNERQLELLNTPQTRGCMTTDFAKYWPEGKVYYTIDSNFGSNTAVMNAMDMISNVAKITFIKRTDQANYIRFVPSSDGTNSSSVGMQGGQQIITIHNRTYSGVIAHEIMHSLGIYHEMSRADRDDYVDINWGNIESSKKHNFYQYSSYAIGTFDYNSIMMYSSSDFAIDGSDYSFTKKDGSPIYGQRLYITYSDAQALRFIYGPTYCKEKTDINENMREGQNYIDYAADITRTIIFYSDNSYTTPTPLSEDRLFKITRTVEHRTGSGNAVPHITKEYIVMPAGTTSYTVEDREYYSIDRGELREHYVTETVVRPIV